MDVPIWVEQTVILAVHEKLIVAHGGIAGLRDPGLLASALARPKDRWAYGTPDLWELAATYAEAIVRNHPFADGNKRTAFMAAYIFLARNGHRLISPEPDATRMTIDLASGEIDAAAYADWLRTETRPQSE